MITWKSESIEAFRWTDRNTDRFTDMCTKPHKVWMDKYTKI